MATVENTLAYFDRMYNLFGEVPVIERNQIRMEKELKEPVKEVQERTDEQINEALAEKERFFASLNDEEYDDQFQNEDLI